MVELDDIVKKMNALDYVYHDLPFGIPEVPTPLRKDNERRTALLLDAYSFEGKRGLDLGCCLGGLTFSLEQAGADIVGVDADPAAIEVACMVGEYYQSSATFVKSSIADFLVSAIEEEECFDFCLHCSVFMWVVYFSGLEKALEDIRNLSRLTDVLFFEVSVGDGMAGEAMVQNGLHNIDLVIKCIEEASTFRLTKVLGKSGWGHRDILMFQREDSVET